MSFTPQSTVYLLDTPLDNTYKNQLNFTSVSAQASYFLGRIKHTFDNVTYQRKTSTIKVNKNIDALWNVNYAMYQNSNFTNKWFYAFITKMEYVSAEVTELFIETDVYQTWLFNVTLKPSFVVREHVGDDTPGLHLVDEGLEIGEHTATDYYPMGELGDNWNVVGVSENLSGSDEKIGNMHGNLITGLTYYPFPNNVEGTTWLKGFLEDYDQAGKPDAIQVIFTVPELAISNTVNDDWYLGMALYNEPPTENIGKRSPVIGRPTHLDSYTPKNNKLFTYPYCALSISNSTGQSAVYRYENFKNSSIQFETLCSPAPNLTILVCPVNYLNNNPEKINYEYGLSMQGFPLATWSSDAYTAWFAQNMGNIGVTAAGSFGSIAVGAATLNPIAVGGGILAVVGQLARLNQAKFQPDQSRGQLSSGSVRLADGSLDFYIAKLTIKKEYAQIIDEFFSMYGYKINRVKIPETRSRQNWNYVQTIDVNITGGIPDEDMTRLKQCYNEGITLWHNPANFCNYAAGNSIR
ncbi:MAG: hypothetical protein PHS04_12285 [Tissierellia bacterium]|nr:hypothetical protein [Tissierellia bacterium]